MVRYGNVAGSRGSVLQLFSKLAQKGENSFPITDIRMTRFWLPLSQGVDFVFKAFQRMQGGEIFVPKIPSIFMTDLAKSMTDSAEIDIIESVNYKQNKLHETGQAVAEEFEYHSGNNPEFLTVEEIKKLNKQIL